MHKIKCEYVCKLIMRTIHEIDILQNLSMIIVALVYIAAYMCTGGDTTPVRNAQSRVDRGLDGSGRRKLGLSSSSK